ncbi:hypothetical protein LTR10_014667 [Elasticomyces elasticus]|uniref:Centromere protein Q n=1 Tax=Exophiala sideris TaxID=1016849 RepID=A0ABR0J6Q0_9EURO|nr:hypothetical protein LTR10_014667 [Elasticomyces elasticus]KAK5029312.1 hypothetical protein LTS07_005774 [Exophiala sideris]KAK5036994.1 hypothetical protein LTR13_005374 [Exophiala sideris]KAK5057942.1 hypothetical protein LTR69_006939 [Exophiala sideris]KAK5181901.1 hypothetical protein LTR44_005502 [Eurotiomycetes sp. CCFEE 6388]
MGASKTSSSSKRKHFATLEPRIKNISQATIQKKWKPLPTTSQDKIRQLLLNIKSKRSGSAARIPPISRARTGKTNTNSKTAIKEEEYEKIVEEVTDKLVSRLPRMPFPPTPTTTSADDTPFDLSNTLHRISSLQSQLTTNIQSAHLLRRQIKREQKALKQDRAELTALERGLKSSSELRRKKERGLHPIARQLDTNEDDGVEVDEIERINTIAGIYKSAGQPDPGSITTLNSDEDADLEPLLNQLRSHLLSMQNNVAGMKPVLAAVDETKMALDLFAARKLDPETLRRLHSVQAS